MSSNLNAPSRGLVLAIADIQGDDQRLERLLASPAYAQAGVRVFLGDIVDGDGNNVAALRRVVDEVLAGRALWIPGNHDLHLLEYLKVWAKSTGEPPAPRHAGQAATLAQMKALAAENIVAFTALVNDFSRAMAKSDYAFLRVGRLFLAHGGWTPGMTRAFGRANRRRVGYGVYTADLTEQETRHAVYGFNLGHSGKSHCTPPQDLLLAVGHHYRRKGSDTPTWQGNILFLDTGSGKGGTLSAALIEPTSGAARFFSF
jgi:protein phosphatase